jgi:RNAse (barnase) inhibitor barstar
MNERTLEGQTIKSPDEFYEQFFAATAGLMPDHGGRNLDALNDDLRELAEPLTIVWTHAGESGRVLGEWFGQCLSVLLERDIGAPVTVVLRSGS